MVAKIFQDILFYLKKIWLNYFFYFHYNWLTLLNQIIKPPALDILMQKPGFLFSNIWLKFELKNFKVKVRLLFIFRYAVPLKMYTKILNRFFSYSYRKFSRWVQSTPSEWLFEDKWSNHHKNFSAWSVYM